MRASPRHPPPRKDSAMKLIVKSTILILAAACTLSAGVSFAEGTPSNGRERFFVKRQNCPWTEEMGKAIYECVKRNDGFNAHWCHNEALDHFCPADESLVPHPPEGDAAKKG
jgi:hypothetical protein